MNNIDNLTEIKNYFRSGAKPSGQSYLGVEVEHFIVNKDTKEAISYYGKNGIGNLLPQFAELFENSKEITTEYQGTEHCIGFIADNFNVTLEPGAQLEISMAPRENIQDIEKIYMDFSLKLDSFLEPYGYIAVKEGYQPKTKVDDIKLIPKKRYELMNAYFENTGTRGKNMMRGTASVQVSIDYVDEEDFIKKLQTAYYIMPAIKYLMDNTKTFEGEKNTMPLRRTYIWDDVDPQRSGVVPDVMADYYGFFDYAEYIYNCPPIFVNENRNEIPTLDRPLFDIYKDKEITEDEIEHAISMVFPDVRAKKYIEIRGADSTETKRVFACAAFIKGLLYNPDFLLDTHTLLLDCKINEHDIRKSEQELINKGIKGKIYGQDAKAFIKSLLSEAQKGLLKDEIHYLDPFFERI